MAFPYVGPYCVTLDVMTPVLKRLKISSRGSILKLPLVKVRPRFTSTTFRSSLRVVALGSTTMSCVTCVSRTVDEVTRTVFVSGQPV